MNEPNSSPPGETPAEKQMKPSRPRDTLDVLKLSTSIVALALTIISAVSGLVVERLPTLQPIVIVLLLFFLVLGIAALLQLYLHHRSLKTPAERDAFLHTLAYALFLFVVMVGGMFARYFWELFQAGKGLGDATVTALLLPLLISLMVFYPLWTMVSGSPRNFFSIVAAFQNGFFWQTIFSGLKPFTPPGG